MPTDTFDRAVAVRAEPDVVWSTITDVATLVDWISIVDQLREVRHLDSYTAVLMDRLGPFKLRADLEISVSDVVQGQALRVRAAGEDRQVASRIEVDVVLTLSGSDSGSTLAVTGSYGVTGKVATMGAGMIRQKATKVLDEFFGRAADHLGAVAA